MTWASMVVAIVLIVTIGKVLSRRYAALGREAANLHDGTDRQRQGAEVERLKERVAVLERVITDNHGSIGLDREIERLRDTTKE